ncbi:HAMP domain-containing histidine kinase [Pyxidicoccus fallax]|uniref:histidine kinase n=1 Tax=Pyxidicoccus fallax TaxID=394095 RepID=A0A848LBR0_9BACT|nr:HAMP domain-containing sensor histidine kinase [Pyxidicoccus fallax]NMO14265.1 HAMP domain-containing histidine kinase [Pyxidicoccus fallax]NPC80040.1 HAMP domain-containing histidine kinase [Pyxidicoccus fallax]
MKTVTRQGSQKLGGLAFAEGARVPFGLDAIRAGYVFAGVLCSACVVLDWAILGQVSLATLPARCAWGGTMVLLGLLGRPSLDEPSWHATLVAVVTAFCFPVIVHQTGGTQSPLFFWNMAIPLCFMAIAHGDLRAVVVSTVLNAAGVMVIVGRSGSGVSEAALWGGMSVIAGLIGMYGTYAHRRVLQDKVRHERERAETLRQLAESERRRGRFERLALVGQLAAGVAHEINNPLAFVSSNLRHLEELRARGEVCDPRELEEIHRETLEGVRRIHQIVRDLKTFARDDSSDGDTSSAAEVVAEALRLGRPKLHGAVRVIDEVPSQLSPVRFGKGRFVQVVLNLLTNAVDATAGSGASRGPEIRIGAREHAGTVILHVEDNGPGISEDALERLFEPFFTTKPAGVGTGLGLALCREYVERVGGTITAENRQGGGARFIVTLPVEAPEREQAASLGRYVVAENPS